MSFTKWKGPTICKWKSGVVPIEFARDFLSILGIACEKGRKIESQWEEKKTLSGFWERGC